MFWGSDGVVISGYTKPQRRPSQLDELKKISRFSSFF